ncbi:spore germination protein GerPE [Neobacillus sp. K501]
MLQRTSVVDVLKITSASFSSTIQLGDSKIINGASRALAVQREADVFYGNEGNFSAYSVFTEPIPFQPITEQLKMSVQNLKPLIKVNNISILAMSSAAILQVGNSEMVSLEARVKHIRQLFHKEDEQ